METTRSSMGQNRLKRSMDPKISMLEREPLRQRPMKLPRSQKQKQHSLAEALRALNNVRPNLGGRR